MSESAAGGVVIAYRKRRNVELVMILFALALGFGAYALTYLNNEEALPENWPIVAGIWAALGIAAHVVVRMRLPYADPLLLPCVLLLNGLGLAMINRIDLIPDPVRHDAQQQLLWTVLGVGLMIAVAVFIRDHRPLQKFTYSLGLVGLVLLLLPLVPGLGREINGSRIWISLAGFSFQPSEAAKVVLAIAFAAYLVEKRDVLALAGLRFLGLDLPRARDLGPILIVWALCMSILVWQTDLGTSLLFFGMFVTMLYIATQRPGWAFLGGLLFVAGGIGAYFFAGHVRVRVSAWLDPFSNYDQNLQIISAQFGYASGGLLGTGMGLGRPGLTPLAKSDFIAAAIGEELGVAGLMAIILIYGLLIERGLRAALAAREPFGKLLAAGLSFVFAVQVFAIIGGVTRLLPLTGLTTPFMSQGGSSMVSNWVIIGLLLVISHQVRKPAAVAEDVAWDQDKTQVIHLSGSR